MNLSQHRIALPDGRRLNVRRWGAAPRLFFIHGFGDGGFVWNFLTTSRLAHLPFVAIDLCGHGDSDWSPARRYDAGQHADDVAAALEALGCDDLTLVGHSLGAEVAIRVAARQPRACVRGLVLVDGGPELQFRTIVHLHEQFRAQSWRYARREDYVAALAARLPLARPEALADFANHALRDRDTQGFVLKCDPALAQVPPHPPSELLWQLLERIACPISIIRAAYSAVLPLVVARKMNAQIVASHLTSVPAAGHALMFDNPAGLTDALAGCTERLGLH